MLGNTQNRWLVRAFTLVAWMLVAGSCVYWAFKLGGGAYVSGTTSLLLKDDQLGFLGPVASDQLFFVISLLIGGVSAGVAGFLVGLPSLRLRGDYLAIVTLGFGEILRVIIQNSDGISKGFEGIPVLSMVGSFIGQFGGALGVSGVPQHSSFFMVWFWVFENRA